MKNLICLFCILLIGLQSNAQGNPNNPPVVKVVHKLTPFNGMHSGFNPDGTQKTYSAQIATMKGIRDFASQNNATNPPYTFGFYQMLYDQAANDNPIQVSFSLPPNKNFKVLLSVETNVPGSTFTFAVDTISNSKTKTALLGKNVLSAIFNGTPSGSYLLIINPEYQMDLTTFLLTEIRILELW